MHNLFVDHRYVHLSIAIASIWSTLLKFLESGRRKRFHTKTDMAALESELDKASDVRGLWHETRDLVHFVHKAYN